MKIIKDMLKFHIDEKTAVAIGKFDGIHRGHKVLVDSISQKREMGFKTAIFTFDLSPNVFLGKESLLDLTTVEEKRRTFERLGIDYLVEYPFNEDTAKILPETFVKEILCENMNACFIAAGEDVSFGYLGKGNADTLSRLGSELGFETEIIEKICYGEDVISSTLVRNVVSRGDMELTKTLLGEPYSISGVVKKGNQLGRKLGMPTVNLLPDKKKLMPPNGVYFSTIEYNDQVFRGVTNIGKKPTVGEDNPVGVETYIYDFHEMIYGEFIKVNLLHFEREEQKFQGLEELKNAIIKNIFDGQAYFK